MFLFFFLFSKFHNSQNLYVYVYLVLFTFVFFFSRIEPDNIDGYQNSNGFDLTYDEQITYNTYLSNAAHSRNMSIALKNDLEQIDDLINLYDFMVNEECFTYKHNYFHNW